MKVLILENRKWREYGKELLGHNKAYKFVAWTIEEVILVAPAEVGGRDFYHRNIVDHAIDKEAINWKFGKPNAFGVIRVIFRKEDADNRICLWRSQTYGTTPEELRPQIREALGLQDVIYKD